MPREYVHLTVLNQALNKLEAHSIVQIQSAIRNHLPYAQIGSMLHDAPYYLKRGKSAEGVALGAFLHGRDSEDTFSPLRAFYLRLEQVGNAEVKAAGLALLAGLISHAETDIIFHPMIFYFTGNYYDLDPQKRKLARKRHRLLETYLDCYLIERAKTKPIILSDIKKHCDTEVLKQLLTLFIDSLVEFCNYPNIPGHLLVDALDETCALQRHFTNRGSAFLAQIINAINLNKLTEFEVLFYRFRKADYAFFTQSIEYNNPVTNSSTKTSIEILLEAATNSTLERLQLVENCLQGTCADFTAYQGPSLNTGLLNTSSSDLKYFSTDLLNLPDF